MPEPIQIQLAEGYAHNGNRNGRLACRRGVHDAWAVVVFQGAVAIDYRDGVPNDGRLTAEPLPTECRPLINYTTRLPWPNRDGGWKRLLIDLRADGHLIAHGLDASRPPWLGFNGLVFPL